MNVKYRRLRAAALLTVLAASGFGSVALGLENPLARVASAPEVSPQPPSTKMTTDFYTLVYDLKNEDREGRAAYRSAMHEERAMPLFKLRGDDLDVLQTYIWLTDWDAEIIKSVESAGAEIEHQDPSRYLLQAWIPLDKIEAISELDGVRQLRRPSYGIPAAGSVTTQGDALLGTSFIRSRGDVDPDTGTGNGLNGCGIKVGIISQGFFLPGGSEEPSERGGNCDFRVISGDFPMYNPNQSGGAQQPLDNCQYAIPGDVSEEAFSTCDVDSVTSRYLGAVELFPYSFNIHDTENIGDAELDQNQFPEGAMITEIAYDLAPGATFHFAGTDTDIELQINRNYLQSIGANVIIDDMVFYTSGRFDGSSVISRRAQQMVLEDNIVYVSATGNQTVAPLVSGVEDTSVSARRFPLFVNGYFSPSQGFGDSKFHNWADGRSPDLVDQEIVISPQGGVVDVILVWDDIWDDQNPRATDDLDMYMYLYDIEEGGGGVQGGDVVAFSADIQDGTGLPIERINQTLFDPGSLVISRKNRNNSAPVVFTLIILQGTVANEDNRYLTHGIAGNNGDALPPVITVGSVDATLGINEIDPTTVPGDSPGPGRAYENDFVRWFTTQQTPAVVSYSNVQTSLGYRLNGSSAAAAHIGGLVALLRHDFPEVPAYDYYSILRSTVTPGGEPFPNATLLQQSTLSDFVNPPQYYRVNGFDTWINLTADLVLNPAKRTTYVSTYEGGQWRNGGRIDPFESPEYRQSQHGLEISPGGKDNVFGFWETDVLAFDGEDGPETALRTDRVYELTVRIGSDEEDATKVPDFRLRLTSGEYDESSLLVVAGRHDDNAPTTIGGKEYKLYYRPTNSAVAQQGVRFALDLMHFEPTDNANATLFLQDVALREMNLPTQ